MGGNELAALVIISFLFLNEIKCHKSLERSAHFSPEILCGFLRPKIPLLKVKKTEKKESRKRDNVIHLLHMFPCDKVYRMIDGKKGE